MLSYPIPAEEMLLHIIMLLVLGSANVDEALRGYMTKYDCSSADLNSNTIYSVSRRKKSERNLRLIMNTMILSLIEETP